MGAGGDGHYSIGDMPKQQVGQREVAEVIGPDLQLESVRRTPLGCSHHSGVVDQYVNLALPGVGERAYRRQIGKIKTAHFGVTGYRRGSRLAFGHIAHG